MIRLLFLFIGLLVFNLLSSSASWAVIETYQFDNHEQELRYQELTKELRCPKCQNNDIRDSSAPIAADMRREVHHLIMAGKDDQAIVNFMVERFGEFVMYRPKVKSSTMLLWFGPAVLFVLGLILIVLLSRRKARAAAEDDQVLKPEDSEALNKILKEQEGEK